MIISKDFKFYVKFILLIQDDIGIGKRRKAQGTG